MTGVVQPYNRRRAPAKYDPGWFDAEHQNIQRGIDGAEGLLPEVSVADFRGMGSKVTNTLQFQRAAAAADAAAPCRFVVPADNYTVTDQIPIHAHRVHVAGYGKWATKILFNPTTPTSLWRFQQNPTTNILYQSSLKDMAIVGAGTAQKIALDLQMTAEFDLSGVAVFNLTGNSGSALTPSIALRTAGHEVLSTNNLDLQADRPIHLTGNPTYPSEGADHFHLFNLNLAALVATEANILIDPIGLANLKVDGTQVWVGGKYGLKCSAGAVPATGLIARIGNYRYEQAADPTGYAVSWEAAALQLHLHDGILGGAGGSNNGGLFVRNVRRTTFENSLYLGTMEALNMDATCDEYLHLNSFFQDLSTISMTGLEEQWSLAKRNTNSPMPNMAYYCNTATGNRLMKVPALTDTNLIVGAAANDRSFGIDKTNNRLVFYANGNRYYVNGTLF